MKRIIIYLMILSSLESLGQIPTYRWLGGSQNFDESTELNLTTPGPRQGSSSFTDLEGNYWLYGGERAAGSTVNGIFGDLWKYDPFAKKWTWMEGRPTVDKETSENNNSLKFNGIDNAIQLFDDPVDYSEDFTVEIAFKREAGFVDRAPLVSWSSTDESSINVGWSIEVVNNGQEIELFKDGFTFLSWFQNESLYDNDWHHIAMVFKIRNISEPQDISLYIDGSYVTNVFGDILENQNPADDHVTSIGVRRGFGSTLYFSGQIDEVRF